MCCIHQTRCCNETQWGCAAEDSRIINTTGCTARHGVVQLAVLRWCQIMATHDRWLQRDAHCGDHKIEPGLTSGSREVCGESRCQLRRWLLQLDRKGVSLKTMGKCRVFVTGLFFQVWCKRSWKSLNKVVQKKLLVVRRLGRTTATTKQQQQQQK